VSAGCRVPDGGWPVNWLDVVRWVFTVATVVAAGVTAWLAVLASRAVREARAAVDRAKAAAAELDAMRRTR
jgi:hypothetical protein